MYCSVAMPESQEREVLRCNIHKIVLAFMLPLCYTHGMKSSPPLPNFYKPAFAGNASKILKCMAGYCTTCDNKVADIPFTAALSEKVFSVSGMCQPCQDSVFK